MSGPVDPKLTPEPAEQPPPVAELGPQPLPRTALRGTTTATPIPDPAPGPDLAAKPIALELATGELPESPSTGAEPSAGAAASAVVSLPALRSSPESTPGGPITAQRSSSTTMSSAALRPRVAGLVHFAPELVLLLGGLLDSSFERATDLLERTIGSATELRRGIDGLHSDVSGRGARMSPLTDAPLSPPAAPRPPPVLPGGSSLSGSSSLNRSGTSVGTSDLLLLNECTVLMLISILPLRGSKFSRLLRELRKLSSLPQLAAERPG